MSTVVVGKPRNYLSIDSLVDGLRERFEAMSSKRLSHDARFVSLARTRTSNRFHREYHHPRRRRR